MDLDVVLVDEVKPRGRPLGVRGEVRGAAAQPDVLRASFAQCREGQAATAKEARALALAPG